MCPGPFGRDHTHIDAWRRYDLVIVNIEAMGEHQSLAVTQLWKDALLVELLLDLVRHQYHNHVGGPGGVRDRGYSQAFGLGLFPRLAAGVEPNDHVQPTILQVQRVGMSLAAIADDRHSLSFKQR